MKCDISLFVHTLENNTNVKTLYQPHHLTEEGKLDNETGSLHLRFNRYLWSTSCARKELFSILVDSDFSTFFDSIQAKNFLTILMAPASTVNSPF